MNDNNDSNDDNNRPLYPAKLETLRQWEASNGDGPASNRFRFLEEIVLFPITILKGRCRRVRLVPGP